MIELLSDGHTTYVSGHHETHVSNENGISLVDQFSFLGNRARYEFIELDMSTGLDEQIEINNTTNTGLSKTC